MNKFRAKKLISVLAVCIFVLTAATGCSAKPGNAPAPSANMPNPLTEISADELNIPMNVPDDAADVKYFTLDDGSGELVYQMMFRCAGHDFTYRAKASSGFDAVDMSGLNYDSWDSAPGMIGNCDGMVKTNEKATAVYWIDIVPGINYTLGCSEGISGDEILAIANAVFAPAQGDADSVSADSPDSMDFIPLSIPEGAENSEYSCEGDISEMQFDYNGSHYVYRASSTSELKSFDLSGIHSDTWKTEQTKVSYCDAVVKTCDSAAVIYWLDIVPGVNYTLSCEDAASAETLTAIANEIFLPLQGEA